MVTAAMKLKDTCSLEKEMATHSSVLAWRIPGTGKPGGLPSMGSHRVGHDWSDLAAAAAWKESYEQSRQHIKNQRHHFTNKSPYSQSYSFPVVMCRCESWTIKKAEHWRTDVFKLCCWRRLLRVPWTARRSYQSILKEINPKYSLEGLMLKLKLQYFGHLMRRVHSLKDPDAQQSWGQEKRVTEGEMVRWHH